MKRLGVLVTAMVLAGCAVKPTNNCNDIVNFVES